MESTQDTAPSSLHSHVQISIKKKAPSGAPLPNERSLFVPHSTFCLAHPSMTNPSSPANDSQTFRASFREIL